MSTTAKRKRSGNTATDASKSSPTDMSTAAPKSSSSSRKQARTSKKANERRRADDDENDRDDDSQEGGSEEGDVEMNNSSNSSNNNNHNHHHHHNNKATTKKTKASSKSVKHSHTSSASSKVESNGSGSSPITLADAGLSTSQYSYPINPPPVGRPVRIYCDGIYDLFHFGHAKALEQAKKAFPDVYLLVGVCDDILTHSRKGKTVMTDKERYESVRHCKWVDEVVESAPWFVDQNFLDKHQIDYVAHDDIPYKSVDSDDVYAFVKNTGRFLPTERTDGVSTSDLITRIVKDYDQYLRRNLERGVTAKELGIGFFKEQEVKLKKSAQDIRASIRQNWHGTKDELKNEISVLRNDLRQTMNMWEDKSQEFVRDFSKLFGADSMVNKIFRRRGGRYITGSGSGSGSNNGSQVASDGNMSSPGPSNASSRAASPETSDFEDDQQGELRRHRNTSPTAAARNFFGGLGQRLQRSRSTSSVDSYGGDE